MRHLYVTTLVGLALVTLMFVVPTVRLGAEALTRVVAPLEQATVAEPSIEGRTALKREVRQPLEGLQGYTARSQVGVPLEHVQLRRGSEPWRTQRLDDRGGWDQEPDDALVVRAPGHWPARANPGTREFVLEPRWALVVQLPPEASLEPLSARFDPHGPGNADRHAVAHGPSRTEPGAYVFAVGVDEPMSFLYDLTSALPVRLDLTLRVEGIGVQRADLRPLLESVPLRALEVTGLCSHAGEPMDVWVEQEPFLHRDRREFPGGSVSAIWGAGSTRRAGRTGAEHGSVVLTRGTPASVAARCGKGCYGADALSKGAQDRAVTLELHPWERIHGRLRSMASDRVPTTATLRVEFGDRWQVDAALGHSPWDFSEVVEVGKDGAFELSLPGRPPTPDALGAPLPNYARLIVEAPGFHPGRRWVDLTRARTHFAGVLHLPERGPLVTLAAGHGFEPGTPPYALFRADGDDVRIDEVAPTPDGRLHLYANETDARRLRERFAGVEALVVRSRRGPRAVVRGVDGDFVPVPARRDPLVVHVEALPPASGDRIAIGWTWRGIHATVETAGRRTLESELHLHAAIPGDATEVWWGRSIGPPRDADTFGGSLAYTGDLERFTIR